MGAWSRCRTPRPAARVRLVCLPHAGGGAGFFGSWGTRAPAGLEVHAIQYPGREDRIDEVPPTDLTRLAAGVARTLITLADRPFALFGHSLGALVGYEATRLLQTWRAPAPAHLFVSGRRAPGDEDGGTVHLRDDEELVQEIERLGGGGAEVLRSPEFGKVFLPAVRADFQAAETYRHRPGPEPSCPVTAVIGTADTEVSAVQASRWADRTTGGFSLHTMPGGHFYLLGKETALLRLLDAELHDLPEGAAR